MSEETSPHGPRERPPPPPGPPPGWGPSGPQPGQGWGQPWQQGWGPNGWGQPQSGPPPVSAFSTNVAGGLTYLTAFLAALVSLQIQFPADMYLAVVALGVGLALALRDHRPEVRFHARQGVCLWLITVAFLLGWHFFGGVAATLCYAAAVFMAVVLLLLMVARFRGAHLKLPVIGDAIERSLYQRSQGRDGPGTGQPPLGWGPPRQQRSGGGPPQWGAPR